MRSHNEIIEKAFLCDYRPKAFINLAQLSENVRLIRRYVGKSAFCAVVKSDAYGHGLCRVSQEIAGCVDCFAVSSLSEGVALRIAGITKPILCLLPVADVARAVFFNIEIPIVSPCDFCRVADACKEEPFKPAVHFAVNTGMNRLGYDDVGELERDMDIAGRLGFSVEGVFSHFYNASDYPSAKRQYLLFKDFERATKKLYPSAVAHICSSGALGYEEFNCDMVRIGLQMYGYRSNIGNLNVKPIMKVIAKTAQCRTVCKGENLLYGDYKTDETERISVLSYGYFDGLEKCVGFNDNCMNLCAVGGGEEYYDLTENLIGLSEKNGDGIYRTLIKAGRVYEKIYYR